MGITAPDDALEQVVESFLVRFRAGERPNIEEYAARYPKLADQVRDALFALATVEQDLSRGGDTGAIPGIGLGAVGVLPHHLGDYLILREIGRGGMGIVYEAIQQSLGRHVALKILPWSSMGIAGHVERFRLEARAAARLHHTNIVPVFGVGEHGGTHYFAMQYIQGQGLDLIIENLRRLPSERNRENALDPNGLAQSVADGLLTGRFAHTAPPAPGRPRDESHHEKLPARSAERTSAIGSEHAPADPSLRSAPFGMSSSDATYFRGVARVALQVAEALAYAHEQGIIHRDIKPSNLLIDVHGTVWVTDFGLSKAEGSDGPTRTGDILGTLRYMAPERFDGHSDARSDLYALGATLYELLTLRPLFDETSRHKLVELVLHQEPMPPRRVDARIPRDLEVICLKCLNKEPSGRYGSLSELAAELRRFLAGETIRARPVGVLGRGWRWCRRNPMVAGLLVAVAAALVAVAGLALVYANRRARDATHIGQLAEQKTAESEKAKEETRRAILRLAILDYERGQAACEQGELGPGLLHLTASWHAAIAAGEPGWQRTARVSLAAWQREYRGPKAIFSHQGSVLVVAFSPDGKTVLTASNDYSARLWDAATAEPIGPPLQHQSSVSAAAFSPDGKRVITGSADRTAQLWDAATGRPIAPPLRHQGYVYSVAFSPDGKRVITGGFDKTARLWDSMTGQPIGQPLQNLKEVNVVRFSPDGKTVLTACDGTVRLWDAMTGQPIGSPLQHQGIVMGMLATFSPNGRTVLTSSFDNTARLWDAATGQPIKPSFQHRGVVCSAVFSLDGERVLTGSYDKTARLWKAATGQPIGPPMEHQGQVRALAFSPDGTMVITGSLDRTARLWDAATGQSVGPPLQHQGLVRTVTFSPDGRTVLTGSDDGTARIWEVSNVRPSGRLLQHEGPVTSGAFHPDGAIVVTGSTDQTARIWETASGRLIGPPLRHQATVYAVAFSPDGETVLTGCGDGTAVLWSRATGQPIGTPWPHERSVTSLSFSPDGARVVSGTHDVTRLWEASSGRLIHVLPYDVPVVAVAFSPNGKTVLTGSMDQTARLWDPDTRQLIGPPLQHQGFVYAVAFSPDGKTIFTGCADGRAQLWDSATGQRVGVPLRHQGFVRAVAFSPDGKFLLIGCGDGTARFWEASTGRPITALKHREAVVAVAFSPDGKTVLTTSADQTARLWPMADLPDDLERVATWVEVLTGLALDDDGSVQVLDNTTWFRRRERVRQAGGSPLTGQQRPPSVGADGLRSGRDAHPDRPFPSSIVLDWDASM